MCKILRAQIIKEIHYSVVSRELFPAEERGCHWGARKTDDMLYIDQHILKDSKTREKNVAMARIDNKNLQ